LYPHVTPIV